MIESAAVRAVLGADTPFAIRVEAVCDSTNTRLLAEAEAGAPHGSVVVALSQEAGRGRRGRTWYAAAGDSLTFSMLWRFPAGTSPAGLSLAVGVAVLRALQEVGAGGTGPDSVIRLKWPNDVLLDGRKLAGILVELVPGAPHAAVIGIGLNLRLPAGMPEEVRAQAAALPAAVEPNRLLAALLNNLAAVCVRFASGGFAALADAWAAADAFRDRPALLLSDFDPPCAGLCRGVDAQGALLFESDGTVRTVLSGELSLRDAVVS